MEKNSCCRISNLIIVFDLISKCFGFAVVKPGVPFIRRSIREISLFLYLILSTGCSIRSELWVIYVLDVGFTEKKVIIFILTQVVTGSTFTCLFVHRLNNAKIWSIMTKIESLEKNLTTHYINLNIAKIGYYGLTFPFVHLFLILSLMYYMILQYPIVLLVDSTCVFYFEVWVAIPCLQFIGWISLLSYVLHRIQCRIIQLNKFDWSIRSWSNFGIKKTRSERFDKLNDYNFIEIKCFVSILMQVMNIAADSATAYGLIVLVYLFNYLARTVAQFYDLIDKDSQRFSIWIGIWNVLIRVVFILPIFICCESFTSNVNKTVRAIGKMTVLHHPSNLNTTFQCLTLRLRHKAPTIKMCGILSITYRSFLTIMTTAVAFLVLQLQSK